MSFEGRVENGVIVFDVPNQLVEGTRVEVIVRDSASGQSTLRERLLKLAGTVDDLPADMAEQHDHYIHGTPKK
ncbi:MAG: hypothetical protein K8R36_10070 [Planctomycetales bacterium]|nr:hypothetical protein [Planctomycetales bacterium]